MNDDILPDTVMTPNDILRWMRSCDTGGSLTLTEDLINNSRFDGIYKKTFHLNEDVSNNKCTKIRRKKSDEMKENTNNDSEVFC